MSDEEEKIKLEIAKLKLEINEKKRWWLRKQENLFPMLTFIVAMSTIIWTWKSGFLDHRQLELSIDKKNLEWDIKNFTSKRDSLIHSNDSLMSLNKKFILKNDTLVLKYQSLQSEKEILDSAINKMKRDTRSMNDKVSSLTLENARLTFIIKNPIKKTPCDFDTADVKSKKKSAKISIEKISNNNDSSNDSNLGKTIKNSDKKNPKGKISMNVPNAWSPNGDGVNDKLMPVMQNIEKLNYFRIYNRWGQLMFDTNIIGYGWDGVLDGKPQEMDIYTWTVEAIDFDGNVFQKSGNSLLLR